MSNRYEIYYEQYFRNVQCICPFYFWLVILSYSAPNTLHCSHTPAEQHTDQTRPMCGNTGAALHQTSLAVSSGHRSAHSPEEM